MSKSAAKLNRNLLVSTGFFLFLSAGVIFQSAIAQVPEQIQLLHANSLQYDQALGKNVRRLIGDVAFQQEGVIMYCDSAYMFTDENRLEAFHNVHIQQGDTLHVYGDLLKYDGNTHKAKLFDHIRMKDKTMTLTTMQLDYDLSKEIASYSTGAKIIDRQNQLSSKYGYYYPQRKEIFFRNNVVLINPEYTMKCDTLRYHTISRVAYFFGPTNITSEENLIYCENGWYNTETDLSQFERNAFILSKENRFSGDSLFYDRKKGIGKAFGNIEIRDTSRDVIIWGDYAEHTKSPEASFVTKKVLFAQVFEKDTLFLHADTLRTYLDRDSSRVLNAYHNVKIFKTDLQGKCDSLIYTYRDSIMKMYYLPVLWADNNQMTADFITIKQRGNEIEKLHMYTGSFIASPQDSLDGYNQIKGMNMTAYFQHNHMSKIDVEGNGQTIYYAVDAKGRVVGINKAECSNMTIRIRDNRVEQISLLKKPGAILYPERELENKERKLPGFKWFGDVKPASKKDLLR